MKKVIVDLSEEAKKEMDENERGIQRISIVKNPAFRKKGYFFSSEERSIFIDKSKRRLVAPLMYPTKIYRKADGNEEEKELIFTDESIDQLFNDFMKRFKNDQIINIDHTDEIADAYIREIWQVENPSKDRSKIEYGLDLPEKCVCVVLQFENDEAFENAIKEDFNGLSMEAFFNEKEYKFKTERMKKKMFKAHKFSEEGKAGDEEVVLLAEKLEEGEKIEVLNSEGEKDKNFTGEVEIESGDVVTLADGVIENVEKKNEESEEFEEEKKEDEEEPKKFSKEAKQIRFNLETEDAETGEGKQVTVIANEDELTEGTPVVVVTESLEVIEDFSGTLKMDGVDVKIEEGSVQSVGNVEPENFEGEGMTEEQVRGIASEEMAKFKDEIIKEVGGLVASAVKDSKEPEKFSEQIKTKPNWFGRVRVN